MGAQVVVVVVPGLAVYFGGRGHTVALAPIAVGLVVAVVGVEVHGAAGGAAGVDAAGVIAQRIGERLDVEHVAVNKHTGFQRGGLIEGERGAAAHLGAVARGGVAAVGGVYKGGAGLTGREGGGHAGGIGAGGLAHLRGGEKMPQVYIVAHKIGVVGIGTVAHRNGFVPVCVVVLGITAYHEHLALGALYLDDMGVAAPVALIGDAAGVGDAGGLAGLHHLLQLVLVEGPMGPEQTGGAGHGQYEGVGGQHVVAQTVVVAVGVVVVYKGHRIAAVVGVGGHAFVTQVEIALAEGAVDAELQTEIEGGRGFIGAVHPPVDAVFAVPELTHREGGTGRLVV